MIDTLTIALFAVIARAGGWVDVVRYGRDALDCQPVPYEVQPYFYDTHGLPDLLELPVQGYQDDFYWERFDDRSHSATYIEYLNWALEYVARHNLVFSLNSHDHGTPRAEAFHQTKGAWLRPAPERAQALGLRFMGCEEYYQERWET